MWQGRKRKLSESVEIVESAKTSVLSFSNKAEHSQTRGNLNRCDSGFLLNEHGDLHFLLHKNLVHIILLTLKKIEKIVGRKKEKPKACAKPLLQHANYDHKNNNSTNALHPCCFKLHDLSANFI